MVEYNKRKGIGNSGYLSPEYKEKVTKFAKLIGFDSEEVWSRVDPWHNPKEKDKKAAKYVYTWTNGDVIYTGQTFNVAKRIYDELSDCIYYVNKDGTINERKAYLYENGYYKNFEKFIKDFRIKWYPFAAVSTTEAERLFIIKSIRDQQENKKNGRKVLKVLNIEAKRAEVCEND